METTVIFDLTGRTVFVERNGEEVGRQLLTVMFESENDRYAWLNNNRMCRRRSDRPGRPHRPD
jgi:hypothetical protein